MITKQQALTEDYFHYGSCTRTIGPRGGVVERVEHYRRTGATQTWKTRPDDFRVPIKFGLKGYGEIVPANAPQFHLPSECPLNAQGAVTERQHMARVQPVTISIIPGLTFWRVVCTCGHFTRETRSKLQAERDLSTHIAEYAMPVI